MILNKPGPAQGSKIAKRLPSVKSSLLQYSKIKNFPKKNFSRKTHIQKNGSSGAQGPLAQTPGALKGGHFRNIQHFCRSWRGTLRRKKQIFEKNLTMPKNWKGTLWYFKHPICCKISKKIKGTLWREYNFRKKCLTMPKNWKGGPFGVFQHTFCRKTSKKWRGGTLWGKFFSQKNPAVPKKIERGTLCSRPVWYFTRENRKKFLFHFARQIVQFGATIFCRTFKNF